MYVHIKLYNANQLTLKRSILFYMWFGVSKDKYINNITFIYSYMYLELKCNTCKSSMVSANRNTHNVKQNNSIASNQNNMSILRQCIY